MMASIYEEYRPKRLSELAEIDDFVSVFWENVEYGKQAMRLSVL
jgi:hypothetical protein